MLSDTFDDEFKEQKLPNIGEGLFDVPLSRETHRKRAAPSGGLAAAFPDLDRGFATKVEATLADCARQGITMVPYTGIRDPWEQARLWRQSRATAVVNQAIARLASDGARFLAAVLRDVGPQGPGPRVTGALPGFSWHQFGEAIDCYWQVDGRAEWNDLTGYRIYAESGVRQGLTAGGYWSSLRDWPHLQLRSSGSPGAVYSTPEIDDRMRRVFGGAREADLIG